MFQRITDAADATKSYMAWVSNIKGFIGLASVHTRAVGCVYNIDNTLSAGSRTKPVTDKMLQQVINAFPIKMRPNMCFMSRASRSGLQEGRTVALFGQGAMRPDQPLIAPTPKDIDDVPIYATDSIPLQDQQTIA
jgi:hypothetical protein